MTETLRLSFFLDHGVPDSVGRALEKHGHSVFLHRNHLPEKTPDEVVATTAIKNSCILVAIDRDMKQIARRYGMTPSNNRFHKLDLIRLCCPEPLAAARLEQALDLVYLEWRFSRLKAARRMWIDVADHHIRTHR